MKSLVSKLIIGILVICGVCIGDVENTMPTYAASEQNNIPFEIPEVPKECCNCHQETVETLIQSSGQQEVSKANEALKHVCQKSSDHLSGCELLVIKPQIKFFKNSSKSFLKSTVRLE